jgi:hypothetical protein
MDRMPTPFRKSAPSSTPQVTNVLTAVAGRPSPQRVCQRAVLDLLEDRLSPNQLDRAATLNLDDLLAFAASRPISLGETHEGARRRKRSAFSVW